MHVSMVCLDDKHRVNVGEPGRPVASVERGKKVLVSRNETFQMCHHDFTRFSSIPSVTFLIDVPDKIDGSWYEGEVYVGFKGLRHLRELHGDVLLTRMGNCLLSSSTQTEDQITALLL